MGHYRMYSKSLLHVCFMYSSLYLFLSYYLFSISRFFPLNFMLREKWDREFFFKKQNLRAGIKTLSWGHLIPPPLLCEMYTEKHAENNVCHLSKCNVYPKCIIYPFIKVYYLSRLGHLGI